MNDKLVFRVVMGISIFVLFAVILLNRKILPRPEPVPEWVQTLPAINACINGTCFCLLLFSFMQIRRKNIQAHKRLNLLAFFLSSVFLVCYILYHWMADETSYPEGNPMRPLYLAILISHIVLAAVVLPFVLLSFHKGLTNQVEKHRKLVRFAFPVWLYVTFTGVVVYLMISPHYPWNKATSANTVQTSIETTIP